MGREDATFFLAGGCNFSAKSKRAAIIDCLNIGSGVCGAQSGENYIEEQTDKYKMIMIGESDENEKIV